MIEDQFEKKRNDPLKNFLAGGVGGICSVYFGHPLDTIKVRLQTMPKAKHGEKPIYTSTLDCARKIIRKEGFFSLYRGVGSMFVGVIPISSLSIFGYGLGKKLQRPVRTNGEYSLLQLFIAGSIGGTSSSVIVTPVERVKCLLQAQETSKFNENISSRKYNGSFDCARQLYKQGGLANFYRGVGITIVRGIPSWGVYFCTYDTLKQILRSKEHLSEKLSPWKTILAGGTAGTVSWFVSIPADVLKSRLQTAPSNKYPNGVRDVFYELKKNEGLAALYKGTTPILIRAFPVNAAYFLGYELTIKALDHFY